MDKKIIDVASAAGVSPATVSRVLNNSPLVKEETKKKVMQAIERLDYHPNAAAKNLRSQRTMIIGVIVPDINVSYFSEIIKGIENAAFQHDYKVIICDAENREQKEKGYLSLLMDRTVDAIIIVTPFISNEEIIRLVESGYSIGLVGRYIEHPRIPCVFTDNVQFSINIVDHLYQKGHRNIAFFSGYKFATDNYERLEGYMKGLKKNRLPFNQNLIENGNFNEEGGYNAFFRLLKNNIEFTAVFAANDEMALGVYRACEELHLNIPKQVAVVGVDNIRLTKYLCPKLSTVDQPKYQMGFLIMEKMIAQLGGSQDRESNIVHVHSRLMIRGSSDYEMNKR